MNVYLVFIRSPGQDARELLLEEFPKRQELAPGLWAIGAESATAVEVCQILGLTKERPTSASSRSQGIVVKLTDYYGMYDPGLWQEIDAWRSA